MITLGGEQEFFGSVAPGPTVISEMDYTISQTTGRLGEQLSRVGAVGTALSVWTLSLPAEKQGEAKISTLPALGVSGASLASPVFATKSSAASGAVQAMNTAATAAVKTGAAASVSTATVISAVSPQSFTFPVDLRLPPLLAQQSKQLTSRISKASAKITRTAEWKKLWPVGELGIGFGWKRRKR